MGLHQRGLAMIERILKSSFLKLTSIVFVGNLLSQLIIFLAFILFARFFDKTEIGIYTVFISLSVLLAIPATGRYELAVMLPKEQRDATGLLKLALTLAGIFSVVLFVLLYLIPFQIYFERLERITELILLLPLGVFFMAAFQSFILYFNKLNKFKLNAVLKFVQAALMLSLSLLLANRFGYKAYALVLAWVLSQAALFFFYLGYLLFKQEAHSISDLRSLAATFKRYPTVSLIGNFVNTFSVELPNYFIPVFWGASVQTLYAYGARVAAMPRNFIGSAIGDVFYKSSSKLAQEDPKALLVHLQKVTRTLLLFSTCTYLVGILTANFLFPIVFGETYAEAVPYFQWMAIASIFLFVQSPISVISDVLVKLQAPLIFNLVSIVCKIGVLSFAAYYLESPVHMIALYAIVTAILSLFWIFYLQKMTKDSLIS
jgi:O-antigen/teichoic acid export membrane protein